MKHISFLSEKREKYVNFKLFLILNLRKAKGMIDRIYELISILGKSSVDWNIETNFTEDFSVSE